MKRILVVDDVEDNRELVALYLQEDYEVVEAGDGREAIAIATEVLPDLILMDLSLPLLTGWEATGQLKQAEATKHIPIVALTAHAMDGDRDKALAAGCTDYMTKPVVRTELLEKVRTLIGV
jgi:two-component system, cell cycle response regulator DivK